MSAARDERLATLLAAIPYARFLGKTADLAGDEMTAILPFSDHLVGNTRIPALHGGVLGVHGDDGPRPAVDPRAARAAARTIDVTIEYLRPRRALTTFARADVRKVGRRIANVHVEAWQESRASPVSALRGHFLLTLPQEGAKTPSP